MPTHPPVPSATKTTFGAAGDHPLMEKQIESSLPLLGDSQFELVLDPSMRVELADDLVAEAPALPPPMPLADPFDQFDATPPKVVAVDDDERDPVEDEMRRYYGRRTLLLVGCNVLVLGAAAYYAYSEVVPLQRDLANLEDKRIVLEHELDQNKTLAISAEAQRSSAEKQRAELEGVLKAKETEWAAKQAILDAEAERAAWVPSAQAALTTALAAELKRGEVLLREDGKQLVIELNDKTLFAGNEPVLGDKGKALLVKVAPLLMGIEGKPLRIGGHVDGAPTGELLARYPTAWELSAVRAAQVARFLEDGAQVPAGRLIVEAYGASRPQVPGKTAAARKRNRRVEISVGP